MVISSAAALMAPTVPMISPCNGSYQKYLKDGVDVMPKYNKANWNVLPLSSSSRMMSIAAVSSRNQFSAFHMDRGTSKGSYQKYLKGVVDVMPKYNKANCSVFPLCSSRRMISITAVSSRRKYGALQMDHGMPKEYASFPRTIRRDLHHRSSRPVITKASNELSPSLSNFSKYFSTKEKPKWWWRTLASIPYFMPLHIMSRYGEGAQNFLPFLSNFEILANPFSGKELPGWFMLVYCFGIYFLVVRNKKLPHFFRFHVIMAILLDNAVQIVGIVAGWMPYWRKLDAPFWTVVAVGLLFIVVGCIRGVLKGTYTDTPLFSEAAFIHTSLP